MTKNRFGFYDGACIDNAEVFNTVLGRKIGWVNFRELRQDWGAFYDNPLKYRGSVVVDMVNKWADEKLSVLQSYDGPVSYGAQSVMLEDVQ